MITLKVVPGSLQRSEDAEYVLSKTSRHALSDFCGVKFLQNGHVVTPTTGLLNDWGLHVSKDDDRRPALIRINDPKLDPGLFLLHSPTTENLFWVPRKYLPLLKSLSDSAHEKGKASALPPEARAWIADHYTGAFLQGSRVTQLLALRSKFPKLLEVPARYTTAYRIMMNLSKGQMAKFGVLNPKGIGFAKGGTYSPLGDFVGSWSASKAMFSKYSKLMEHLAVGHVGLPYTVILAADLSSQRSKFLFNPAQLPKAVGVNDYAYQNEVVSVGPVKLHGLSYFINPGESEDGSDNKGELRRLLKEAVELLP